MGDAMMEIPRTHQPDYVRTRAMPGSTTGWIAGSDTTGLSVVGSTEREARESFAWSFNASLPPDSPLRLERVHAANAVSPRACGNCGGDGCGPTVDDVCPACGGLGVRLVPSETARARRRSERLRALLDAIDAYRHAYSPQTIAESGDELVRCRDHARAAMFAATDAFVAGEEAT